MCCGAERHVLMCRGAERHVLMCCGAGRHVLMGCGAGRPTGAEFAGGVLRGRARCRSQLRQRNPRPPLAAPPRAHLAARYGADRSCCRRLRCQTAAAPLWPPAPRSARPHDAATPAASPARSARPPQPARRPAAPHDASLLDSASLRAGWGAVYRLEAVYRTPCRAIWARNNPPGLTNVGVPGSCSEH